MFVSSVVAYDSKEFAKSDTHDDLPMEPFAGPGRPYNTDVVLKTFSGNFPFWRPDPNNQGLYRISSDKAYQAGWRNAAL